MQHFLIFHPVGPICPHHFSPAKYLKILKLLLFFQKCPSFSTVQSYVSNAAFHKKWKEYSCWHRLLPWQFSASFKVHVLVTCHHATHTVEMFHTVQLFFVYHIPYLGRLPWGSHYLEFSTFISIPQHLPISIRLPITRCSSVSSLFSSMRSSVFFTVRIICAILKNWSPSRASLVRYSLYKLNRIGGKQHPYLNPLPKFTLLVSSWSSRNLTLRSKYCLLMNLLSLQSIPTSFRASIILEQFTWSNTLCQSMKQGQVSLSMPKVRYDISLTVSNAPMVPLTLLNPNLFLHVSVQFSFGTFF